MDSTELINLFKDSTPADDVILQGGRDIITRWWVEEVKGMDRYGVFLAKYHRPVNNSRPWTEYMTQSGKWVMGYEGTMIEPCLVLFGNVVHVLGIEGFFVNRENIAKELNRVCAEIIAEVLIKSGAVEEEMDDPPEG